MWHEHCAIVIEWRMNIALYCLKKYIAESNTEVLLSLLLYSFSFELHTILLLISSKWTHMEFGNSKNGSRIFRKLLNWGLNKSCIIQGRTKIGIIRFFFVLQCQVLSESSQYWNYFFFFFFWLILICTKGINRI